MGYTEITYMTSYLKDLNWWTKDTKQKLLTIKRNQTPQFQNTRNLYLIYNKILNNSDLIRILATIIKRLSI